MNQPKPPDDNQASSPEPGIRQEALHSTFGAGQQAAIGNDNIQNQGNNNWLGNTLNFFLGQQTTTPIGNPARPKNERILLTAVKEEVTARLRQSLHNTVLINLGKESQPQQVKRPWDAEIKIGLKPAVPLPNTTTILQVFDSQEIAGKLLILGAPGSGKTTTQLELAQALVQRAQEQPDYPVPVLFNLSSWKDDRQSINEWLIAELKSKYGVSKKLGQEWVKNHQLLPLLDGLDELEPQRQELCVHAINSFLAGETRPFYLVVCSRIEEYSNYSTQLRLNGAIYLQPLTNNQICDYLTSINYIELWSTISSDLDLLELVQTPLLLSLTVLASQEISIEQLQNLTSTEDRIQYLLDAYIGRMLTRDTNSRAYFKTKPPNDKRTRMWLVWLAQQMQKESKTEFLIEEMQPQIIGEKLSQWQYWLLLFTIAIFCTGIIFTTSLLPYFQPPSSLGIFRFILVLGLIPGFILATESKADAVRLILYPWVSLFCSLLKRDLPTEFRQSIPIMHKIYLFQRLRVRIPSFQEIERDVLSQLRIMSSLFPLICLMPIILLIHSLHILLGNIIYSLGFKNKGILLIRSFIKVTRNTKLAMKQHNEYNYPHFMNYAFMFLLTFEYARIAKKYLILKIVYSFAILISILPCIFIAIFLLIDVCLFRPIEKSDKPNQGFYEGLNTVLFIAVIQIFYILFLMCFKIKPTILSQAISLTLGLSLSLTCLSLMKHLSLRIILWCHRYIPWNYARFLDYCTERLFLQRVGGRYRFIHKLLQDHFAQMEFRKP